MRRLDLFVFLLLCLVFLPSRDAEAAEPLAKALVNPAVIDLTRGDAARGRFVPSRDCASMGAQKASALRRVGNEVEVTLNVQMTDPATTRIRNPSAQGSEPATDQLKLRSYNGCLVGPTIEVEPEQTVRLTLRNDLPAEAAADCPEHPDHTKPNCFNTTNLHTHGLHVSPTGNSDNVLIEVPPGTSFPYEFNIPADHPAGTFWYHSHRHGSTAAQVASGMVGALIVRGSRRVEDKLAGRSAIADIDTILMQRDGRRVRALKEQVLVFEQLSYACFDGDTLLKDGERWICPADHQPGVFKNFDAQLGLNAGASRWQQSGRATAVNGIVWPRLEGVRAGEVQRWRMVHGGIRDGINVKILQVDPKLALEKLREISRENLSADAQALVEDASRFQGRARNAAALLRAILETGVVPGSVAASAAREDLIGRICGTQLVGQVDFAADGLTRKASVEKVVNHLQPGYRSDVLVALPEAGLYCVVDGAVSADGALAPGADQRRPQRLLMTIMAEPGRPIPVRAESRYRAYVLGEILRANRGLPAAVRGRLQANDLSDYAFTVDFAGTVDRPVSHVVDRALSYRVGFNPQSNALTFGWAASLDPTAPLEVYDPAKFPFQPLLESVEGWRLTSTQNHIHHIHVNPFEIADVIAPDGVSVFAPGGLCSKGGTDDDLDDASSLHQYCDQQGLFRDTIFIRGNQALESGGPSFVNGATIAIRTRYERYIGAFVLHCHILDHEDQGMMANVEIVPPSAGGPDPHSHSH